MMGVLSGGLLLGLLCMAWPLYLHLTRRRRLVHVVPSLRLFATSIQKRRLRVDSVALLIARLCALAALVVLVAQPFLKTRRVLPLPLLDDPNADRHVLGVLLDDSPLALHGPGAETRLATCRERLSACLRTLPANVRVSIATTTCPRPTALLTPEEACALVDGLRASPVAGRADRGLVNLGSRLDGKSGALLVMAARDSLLWDELRRLPRFDCPATLQFYDTTDRVTPAYVRDVVPGSGLDEWRCTLYGDPEALEGKELLVESARATGGFRNGHTLSRYDAVQRRLTIRQPAGDNEDGWFVSLVDGGNGQHPWHSYFVEPRDDERPSTQAVVLRESGERARTTAALAATLLAAVRPRLRITHHLASGRGTAVPPDAAVVVIIGTAVIAPDYGAWLERQVKRGVRLVCLPTEGRASGVAHASPFVPRWGTMRNLPSGTAFEFPAAFAGVLSGTVEAGLREVAFPRVRGMVLPEGAGACVRTSGGDTLVAFAQFTSESAMWALGFPLTRSEDSVVFHPVFPLLFSELLGAGREQKGMQGSVLVGTRVDATEWFGCDIAGGAVAGPDGTEASPAPAERGAGRLVVSQAGFYRLTQTGTNIVRVANVARPEPGQPFSRERWENAFTNAATRWIEGHEAIDIESFAEIRVGERETLTESSEKTYDLSPLFAALLLLLMFVEGATLFLE